MSLELEIIVYGGGDSFRQFFNAIALSMGSSGYEKASSNYLCYSVMSGR